jgi:twitching motility protein PilI
MSIASGLEGVAMRSPITNGERWLSPTEALDRFRLPDGAAFDRTKSAPRQVRYGFRVASLNFLIRPRIVSEVMAMIPIARVPNSPPWLLGLINLRSNLVPVFDLALICALERQQEEQEPWILVLDKGESAVALLIDGQPEALSRMSPLSHLPSLPTALRSAVTGGYTANEDLWLELDHQAFFSALGGAAADARR